MDSLGYDICYTARKIYQHLNTKFSLYNITPEQWVVLKSLFEKDQISQKELSLRVEKDPNTIKAIVDKLEKKEYLKRLKNPSDKRAFLLILTESGYELVKTLEAIDKEVTLTISKGLTEEETGILKSTLSKIVLNLID